MQNQIVNEDYLSQLISLSKEQQDDDLVSILFHSLEREYAAFLKECAPYLTDPSKAKDFQARIHKLKNNFFNLGCEEAGSALEEMYQELKNTQPSPERLKLGWDKLQGVAQQSFEYLRKVMSRPWT